MAGVIISGERRIALETLHERAARAAAGLSALGVGENDALALLLRNDIAFLEATLAANRLGAYAVPINWHNTSEEVSYVLADCTPKALIGHADLLRAVPGAVPANLPVFGVPTPPEIAAAYGVAPEATASPGGASDWASWLDGQEPATGAPRPFRGSMMYTSGTTGRPKGVRRQAATPNHEALRQAMSEEVFGVRPGMRTVITGTLYHSAPNAYALAAIRCDGTIVLQPRFDAESLLALIAEHSITHLHMVPTMFVRLLALPEPVRARYDVSSLEWAVHGAAPCPDEVKAAMLEWWGPIIHEYYGSTETGLNTCASSQDWLERPGTVGRPTRHNAVRIVDEDGTVLGRRQVGRVYVYQEVLPDFTYHRMDESRRAIELHGYLSVGDVGYLDEDGYLFLCDRIIDMIISGGVNVYPAEIEAVLIGMPGVRDCAVFGIPDPEFGELVAAAIQPDPGADLTADAVQGFLRQHLAGYKVPRHIEFRDELPREDSGKIFKRRLRAPYWEGTGRSI